jgi:hypothetical protein
MEYVDKALHRADQFVGLGRRPARERHADLLIDSLGDHHHFQSSDVS